MKKNEIKGTGEREEGRGWGERGMIIQEDLIKMALII